MDCVLQPQFSSEAEEFPVAGGGRPPAGGLPAVLRGVKCHRHVFTVLGSGGRSAAERPSHRWVNCWTCFGHRDVRDVDDVLLANGLD